MHILIALDSFKGSLSSLEAGEAVRHGLAAGWGGGPRPTFTVIPIADGGEGTVEAFRVSIGGTRQVVACLDPLGAPVRASFLILPDGTTAVVETASACGLPLVEGRTDILGSDTRGLGQQIRAALDLGATRILVGLGGSATNDWGAGMLQALGARFLDAQGQALAPTPRALAVLARADLAGLDFRLHKVQIEAICDVANPLLGLCGAAAVYGPQKGANAAVVETLGATGGRYADAVEIATGRRFRDEPGAGAAGGLGFALKALGAKLRPGSDIVCEIAHVPERLRGAALAITGEGRLDAQSLQGKAPAGIARLARAAGVPCVAFCGSCRDRAALTPEPFAAIFEILPLAASLADAMARGGELLAQAAGEAAPALARLACEGYKGK